MSEPKTLEGIDPSGRKLLFTVMDPGDQLDLYEAAGDQSGNRQWMFVAMIVSSLLEIDGVPVPRCRTKEDVKRTARLLGNEGLAVGNRLFFEEKPEETADTTASDKESAKN